MELMNLLPGDWGYDLRIYIPEAWYKNDETNVLQRQDKNVI